MATARHPQHYAAIGLIADWLAGVFHNHCHVRVMSSFCPEPSVTLVPDVVVAPGGRRDFAHRAPDSALLVVEVSDVSLAVERTMKASIYARAGIGDYWIVNLVDHSIEVYRDPLADAAAPAGARYARYTVYQDADSFSPLAAPAARVTARDLLP